jgi:hypothetical protein
LAVVYGHTTRKNIVAKDRDFLLQAGIAGMYQLYILN